MLQPLARSVSIPLWVTETASATDVEIHKKIYSSGCCPELAHGHRPQLRK